jgi:DNA-binding CsgD family transcriptional regulator
MAIGDRTPAAQEGSMDPDRPVWESDGQSTLSQNIDRIARMATEDTREFVDAPDGRSNRHSTLLLASLEALDALRIGLVVCNISGQPLLANRTAATILRARDVLANSDGFLRTTEECGQPSVDVVRRAVRVTPGGFWVRSTALAVQRTSSKRALTLLVRSAGRVPPLEFSARPAALVLMLDSALPVKTSEIDLNQLYGFTFAEARLANLLMDGKTLDDCARDLGICRSTARTHLTNLFKKADVHCQSELVSLLLRSIGLARLGQIEN